ncbi:MAG: hypothetical protein ABJN42_22560 [Roseibium sp.]|uniref:hypothetical protein n=1 Tax=Roseibium sp. TaxID=1936156 RepID=UPI003299A57E
MQAKIDRIEAQRPRSKRQAKTVSSVSEGVIDHYDGMDFAKYPGRGKYGLPAFKTDPEKERELAVAMDVLTKLARDLEAGSAEDPALLEQLNKQVGRVRRISIRAGVCSPVPGTWKRKAKEKDLPMVLPLPPDDLLPFVADWAANPKGKPPPFKGSPEGHPIHQAITKMGYSASEGAMVKAMQFRLSEVTGFRWPNRVMLKWLSTTPDFSEDEAKIISYAFGIHGNDLNPSLSRRRTPGHFVASTALDEFCRHIKANQLIPDLANTYGLSPHPDGPALDRLRLAITCRNGEKVAKMSQSDLMDQACYLLGAKFGDPAFWDDLTDGVPEQVAEKISGTCGVEACWVTGEAPTAHSALKV